MGGAFGAGGLGGGPSIPVLVVLALAIPTSVWVLMWLDKASMDVFDDPESVLTAHVTIPNAATWTVMMVTTYRSPPYGLLGAGAAVALAWLFLWLDSRSVEAAVFIEARVVCRYLGAIIAGLMFVYGLGPSGVIAVVWGLVLVPVHQYVWFPFRLDHFGMPGPKEVVRSGLVGAQDVAEILGRTSLGSLPQRDPSFPKPAGRIGRYPLWDPADIRTWAERQPPPAVRSSAQASTDDMTAARQMAEQGDREPLRALAEAGNPPAAEWLAQRGELGPLRVLADAGNTWAAEWLAERGEVGPLLALARSDSTWAANRLDEIGRPRHPNPWDPPALEPPMRLPVDPNEVETLHRQAAHGDRLAEHALRIIDTRP